MAVQSVPVRSDSEITDFGLLVSEIDYNDMGDQMKTNYFDLSQIDPVEAKCIALRHLLSKKMPQIPDEVIANCLSREKMVRALKLYGHHFHRHLPVIHPATFNLTEAPCNLLLAMFCVGACYDNNLVPLPYLLKMTMHILIDIESQQVSELRIFYIKFASNVKAGLE